MELIGEIIEYVWSTRTFTAIDISLFIIAFIAGVLIVFAAFNSVIMDEEQLGRWVVWALVVFGCLGLAFFYPPVQVVALSTVIIMEIISVVYMRYFVRG